MEMRKKIVFFFVKNVIPFYYNIIARTFILFRQFILNLLDAATQSFLATRCTHTHTRSSHLLQFVLLYNGFDARNEWQQRHQQEILHATAERLENLPHEKSARGCFVFSFVGKMWRAHNRTLCSSDVQLFVHRGRCLFSKLYHEIAASHDIAHRFHFESRPLRLPLAVDASE